MVNAVAPEPVSQVQSSSTGRAVVKLFFNSPNKLELSRLLEHGRCCRGEDWRTSRTEDYTELY